MRSDSLQMNGDPSHVRSSGSLQRNGDPSPARSSSSLQRNGGPSPIVLSSVLQHGSDSRVVFGRQAMALLRKAERTSATVGQNPLLQERLYIK